MLLTTCRLVFEYNLEFDLNRINSHKKVLFVYCRKMTPTSPQPTEKCQIIITHYINPSLFWFKNQSSDTMQFLSHEMELQAFARLTATKLIFSGGYQPARGEIVLVLSLRWDKWVRCKVEEIIEFSGVPEYTVWLIDYGWVNWFNSESCNDIVPRVQSSTSYPGQIYSATPQEFGSG